MGRVESAQGAIIAGEAGSTMTSPKELLDRDRKAEHIRLALEDRMQFASHPFERWVFDHDALPDLNFDAIDL